MAAKCFMCGSAIAQGILCEKCDKPRGKKPSSEIKIEQPKQKAAPTPAPPPPPQPSTPPPSAPPARNTQATAPAVEIDPFPKAPVVTFPIESASLAITSIVNLLVATGAPSILVGADRSVKYVPDDAKKLLDASQQELSNLKTIETKIFTRI